MRVLLVVLAAAVCRAASPSDSLVGRQIDTVIIDNRDVYDTSDPRYDHFVFKWANAVHIKTRSSVVGRELLLRPGYPYDTMLAEETARNLRQRFALYDAWTEPEILNDGRLALRVTTVDAWSLTGGVRLSSNGNQTDFRLGAEEENLLGMNQFLAFYYNKPANERSYVEMRFSDNRFAGRPVRVGLQFNDDPRETIRQVSLEHPFYSLDQRWSISSFLQQLKGRRDTYADQIRVASSSSVGDRFEIEALYRTGGYMDKLSFGGRYRYRFHNVLGTELLSGIPSDSIAAADGIVDDSLYHFLALQSGVSNFTYTQRHRIDGFGFTEDFQLGTFLTFEYGRGFTQRFNDHVFDQLDAHAARYFSSGRHLVFADAGYRLWFRDNNQLQRQLLLSAKHYWQPSASLTTVLRAEYLASWNNRGGNTVVLGGDSGLRGYDRYFRTGSRRIVLNAETRLFPGLEILSVEIGAAVFVDAGRIWKHKEAFEFRDFEGSAGLGLRFAFEKTTRTIIRMDWAWSEGDGWQISVSTNQYFSAGGTILP